MCWSVIKTLYYGQLGPQKAFQITPVHIDRETDKMYYLSGQNASFLSQVNKALLGKNIGGYQGYFKMFSDNPDIIIERFEEFRKEQIESMEDRIKDLRELKIIIN